MKLRVLSYNIHKCIGGVDRRYEPTRIAEVIRKLDADILMLQEVDAGVARSKGDQQVEVLGVVPPPGAIEHRQLGIRPRHSVALATAVTECEAVRGQRNHIIRVQTLLVAQQQ